MTEPPVWGYSAVEPTRGHVREAKSYVVEGVTVGFALCGALLIDNMPDQEGEFPRCTQCLTMLE